MVNYVMSHKNKGEYTRSFHISSAVLKTLLTEPYLIKYKGRPKMECAGGMKSSRH